MRIGQFVLAMIILGKSIQVHSFESEQLLTRRIQAHLTIKDYASAVEEAKSALILYPQSKSLYESYIRALAKSGNEKQLLMVWEKYTQQFPDQKQNRELIEDMAWGVLQKAINSSSIIMREMALLAAFFSQDAKGVAILNHGMKDPNYAVRAVAVKLAGNFRDHLVVEEVKRLFKEEKVWTVRQKVIESIGKMKITSLRNDLETLIASDESQAGDKALAIAALLELLDTVNRIEIEKLAGSNRAGLRELACEAIAYFSSMRDVDQLLILGKDSHPEVRLAAFQALGVLRPVEQAETILALSRQGVKDANYKVAISAAWLLTLYVPDEGKKALEFFLHSERREVRLLAASALATVGRYGSSLAVNQFRHHPDSLVRLNLALGLIGQRLALQEVTQHVKEMLIAEKEKLSSVEVGNFRIISDSSEKRGDDEFGTSESDNQLVHLELLNILAMLKTPDTQQVVRRYLSERSWEISATAAILLLTEGDDSSIEIVQQLLKDSQPRVRLNAALILSLWSRDESAIQVLELGYDQSDWGSKARILEGLGRIGSTRSIPFLMNVLHEPSQTLRLIAAMALIQCLNH